MYRKISLNLEEELKKDRIYFANLENVPPYCVFDDKTITMIVKKLPVTKQELMKISGIKNARCEKYGERIISTIKNTVNNYDINRNVWINKAVYEKNVIDEVGQLFYFIDKGVDPFTGETINGLSTNTINKLRKYCLLGKKLEDGIKKASNSKTEPIVKKINNAKPSRVIRGEVVEIGDTVLVKNLDNNKEWEVTIVPVYITYTPSSNSKRRSNDLVYVEEYTSEADIYAGKINDRAPLAKAMLGKCEGEEFSFEVNSKFKKFVYHAKILKINKK